MEFFHGLMVRDDAEKLVKGRDDGTFLLRKSIKGDTYVISLAFQGVCYHYSINPKKDVTGSTMYSIQNGTPFPSLELLCEHYRNSKGGLKVRLDHPIPNVQYINTEPEVVEDSPYETEIDWFHNEISREEDSRRLTQGYRALKADGLFLIRKKEDRKYVLSLVKSARVYRYIIVQDVASGLYFITDKYKFQSLEKFVEFHRLASPEDTGIQTKLTAACPKPSGVQETVQSKQKSVFPTDFEERIGEMKWDQDLSPAASAAVNLHALREKHKWLSEYMDKCTDTEQQQSFKSIYWNHATDGLVPDLLVDRGDIFVTDRLGDGNFGQVCLGYCRLRGEKIACAVKYLKGDDIVANKTELIKEATVMQKLDHPHIVRLLGVCDDGAEIMMVLELALGGPFKAFIDKHTPESFPVSDVASLMTQVCYGMRYLAAQNIVHRDLAARNILLVDRNFAKVSDFGMSKVLMNTENYYRSTQPGRWPLRWYSPEALHYYKFTTKCDVWSFGVAMWEAFSYGGRPYKNMKGNEILQMVDAGQRLARPESCPAAYYEIMLRCWTYEADERPGFQELAREMEHARAELEQP